MRRELYWELLKQTYEEWTQHNAGLLGAALAYYAVLSLAPLVVLLIATLGLLFGPEAARGSLETELQRFMGPEAAVAVQQIVASVNTPSSGIIASAISIIALLLGASGVAIALQQALNMIWDVPPRPSKHWWGPILRQRLVGFATVVVLGFVLVLSLGVTTAIALLEKFFTSLLPVPASILQSINFVVSLAVTTFLFALLFRTLPDRRIAWRRVWLGSGVTALLFAIGRYLIGLYLGRASVGSPYGAAGSLIVVLVWVYYSAQVFLFGAEFTHVYAKAQAAQAREARRVGQRVTPFENPPRAVGH
jgi:membrane protein